MSILRGTIRFLSAAFRHTADEPDDDECPHHSNAGIKAMRSRRKKRNRAERDFNLANIKIPVEDCVMNARHAWRQELIPGYGAQSDLYMVEYMLASGRRLTREELLNALYYDDIPELDEDSVETIFDMELRDPGDQPLQAASG